MEIGEFVRNARKSKDWTQAFAAREIGIQQSYLSKIENGQLVPSQEVLEKIQLAYDLTDSSFTVFFKKTATPLTVRKSVIFTLFVGLFIVSSGFFELFFHQTYYTYKAESVSTSDVATFHVTDQYQGESYSDVFAKNHYQYSLIGTRNIPRTENNWLKAIGMLIVFLTIGVVVKENWSQIKK